MVPGFRSTNSSRSSSRRPLYAAIAPRHRASARHRRARCRCSKSSPTVPAGASTVPVRAQDPAHGSPGRVTRGDRARCRIPRESRIRNSRDRTRSSSTPPRSGRSPDGGRSASGGASAMPPGFRYRRRGPYPAHVRSRGPDGRARRRGGIPGSSAPAEHPGEIVLTVSRPRSGSHLLVEGDGCSQMAFGLVQAIDGRTRAARGSGRRAPTLPSAWAMA